MTTEPAVTPTAKTQVRYRHIEADGVRVFYREAGNPTAPVLLLLHGFPSSSHMYRQLIAELSGQYRVIAPDLPGFGFTEVPEARGYVYTFEALATTIDAFVETVGLKRYALYVFDYGSPVGLRLALAHPERVTALVSQNGNAYLDGLSEAWDPIQQYWKEPTQEHRDAIRSILTLEGTRGQYTHGVADPELVAPESYMLDYLLLQRPGQDEIQLDLFLDYANNLKLYPAFQAYFRQSQVPTLVIWGKHDPFFIPPGAEAFQRDNPKAVVELLDTGHFALETHWQYIAGRIRQVLGHAIV
jgi:pimeloyl-ACP methyl ester carboxylesterase